jgi:hypothetical protein
MLPLHRYVKNHLEVFMKTVLVLAGLLAAGSAHAYSSLRHTCAEAQDAVQSNGAMVIHTGHGTYDRYVSSGYYCSAGEWTYPAWIPTADADSCFVGYTCAPQNRDGG